MDENVALRNFKDFLSIYNQMAEICFTRCVNSLNNRNLTSEEENCVDHCAAKQINVNHKMMSVYVEVQPQMTQRRNEEMQRQLSNAGNGKESSSPPSEQQQHDVTSSSLDDSPSASLDVPIAAS